MTAVTEKPLGRLERPIRAVAIVFIALAIVAMFFAPFAQDKWAFFVDRMVFAAVFSFASVGVLLAPEPLRTRFLRYFGVGLAIYFPGVCIVLLLGALVQFWNVFLWAPQAFDWLLPGAIAVSSPTGCYGWWHRYFREGRMILVKD